MITEMKFVLLVLAIGLASASLKCGGRTLTSLSPDTWMCCGGKAYNKRTSVFACCNKECYNAVSQLCCGNEVYSRVNSNSACCDGKFYQRGGKGCCNGQIIDLKAYDCCRHVKYNIDDSICCDGNVIPKDKSGKRTVCCAGKLYDPTVEKCCAEKVVVAVAGNHTKCCDVTPYNSQSHSCCDEKVIIRVDNMDTCCDGQMINSKETICCGGHAQPLVHGKQNTGCCRIGESVAPAAEYAEDMMSLMKSNRNKRSHMGHFVAYDKATEICCSGKLNKKVSKDAGCCNRKAYDVRTQICCGVKIYDKTPGKQERCCDDKPYDRKSHICCQDELHALIAGGEKHSFCCGTKLFDRRSRQCEKDNTLVSLECHKEDVVADKDATK